MATARTLELEAGSVLVATGTRNSDAARIGQYGYGRLPNVITSFELESIALRRQAGDQIRPAAAHVTIIHCVGSRSRQFHSYARVSAAPPPSSSLCRSSPRFPARTSPSVHRYGGLWQRLRGVVPQVAPRRRPPS